MTLTLRAYTVTLIVCASLYFLRAPGISVYAFDAVWFLGLVLFPQYYLRMPRENYFALIAFSGATFASILYVGMDSRPIDLPQAIIILMRYAQMAISANFFYRCVKSGDLLPRDFLVSALISVLIPLWGGLALHTVLPGMTVVFNRYAGYFGNPNSLALYVVISTSVFYTVIRFQAMSRWMTYPLSLLFFVTAIYSLMLSGSNSGMLLFVIVTIIAWTGSLRGAVTLTLAAGIVFLSLAALKDTIMPLALNLTTSEFAGWQRTGILIVVIFEGLSLDQLGSHIYRDDIQEYLFSRQFQDFWSVLLGLGPGQSKYLIQLVDGNTVTVHNFYMLLFLEHGVVGSVSFAAMALLAFHRFHWNYQTLVLFSGFCLASVGTPSLYLPFFWVPLFAAIAGLTQAYHSRFKEIP